MSQETTPAPEQQRRTVLAPYLIRLKAVRSGAAVAEDLQLDVWERGIVEKTNGNADVGAWCSLVAEGIAFRTKYEADLRRLGSDADAVDVVLAQLTTDAAVGLALMAETQQSVNLMVLSGKIDAAKKLSGFRNKIVHGVSAIKERIGETAFRNAEKLSKKMTASEESSVPASAAAAAEPVPGPARDEAPLPDEPLDVDALIAELPDTFIRRSRPAARPVSLQMTQVDEDTPRRIKGLLVVLVALVVVWCVLILPRLGRGVDPLPVLTERSMPQNAAIRELIARPPSLFVEVDGAGWKAMSRSERRQLVKEFGEIAAASGYTGVQFRDTDGSSVAQWLQSQGVWLANAAISN